MSRPFGRGSQNIFGVTVSSRSVTSIGHRDHQMIGFNLRFFLLIHRRERREMKRRWDGVWFGNLNGTRTSGGRHAVQDKSSLMASV